MKTQRVLGNGWGWRERDFCINTEMNRGGVCLEAGGVGEGAGGFCPKLDMPLLYFKGRHALSLNHLRSSNVQIIVR